MTDDEELAALNAQVGEGLRGTKTANQDDKELAALNAVLGGNSDEEELAALNAGLGGNKDDEELAALNAGVGSNRDDEELAALNGETPKKSLGIFGTLGAQTDAKAGREVGTIEAIAENTPVVGQIMDAEYNRQWNNLRRLYEGDFKNSLEATQLALGLGFSAEDTRRINEEAAIGPKPRFGGAPVDLDTAKALYKELVAPEFAKRLQARQAAEQKLAGSDLNWVQKGVVGGVGATKMIGSMASGPLAAATLAVDATNRAAEMAEGRYTLDENGDPTKIWWKIDANGNPVRDEVGNLVPSEEVSGDMAMLKGFAGAGVERFIWMGLGKLTRIGFGKAVGAAEKTAVGEKVSEVFAKAASGTMKGVKEATEWLGKTSTGRAVLSFGKVLGWLNEKGKFGSIPDMMVKSRIQEFADKVVGLSVADPDEREKFTKWLGKFVSVKENAELFTEMLAMHLAMKVGGKTLNLAGKGLEKIGLNEGLSERNSAIRTMRDGLAELIGEERAAKLSEKDLFHLYKLITWKGFTLERAKKFAENLAGDVDAAQKLIDEGASLSSLAEGLKTRRQYSDEFVAGAKAAAAELRDRVTLDNVQSGKVNNAALNAAEGNVEIAAKVAALAKARLTNKHTQVDDADGLEALVAEAMRPFEPEARAVKIHDLKGNRDVGAQLTALEELGIASVEDAELNGVVKRDESGRLTGDARQAVNIAAHGTETLKGAVRDGAIDAATAEALITVSHTELGVATPEERAAFIDGVLERAQGDAALARRMVELAAEAARPDMAAEGLDAIAERAKASLELEEPHQARLDEITGCKLTSIEGGKLGCSRFRGMTAEFEELGPGDGDLTQRRGEAESAETSKVLRVKGLGEGQLAKPGNWADGAVLVVELQRVAEKNGAVLDFGSIEANTEAAGLLNKVKAEGLERAKARLETRAKLFDVLARTALDTGVTFDEASFRKALEESSNGRRLVDNHGNIYGITSPDGTLHFNPTQLDYNIPIHEYGHLALESMKGVNRRLWERGMELVKGSDYYRSIKEQAETEGHEYSYLKGDEAGICDEALATMIGDRGEKLVEAQGVGAELKAWLKDFWKAFKGAFGLADMTDAQIEKMTLGEFVDAVNAELLRGKEFGTRKDVPLKEKSIRRYDEAEGSGSNGILRWKNDRGRLFYIPVDMERTRPGGKVVLATDDANITDWIKNRLNGVELRMSKSGEIYVKGRNGFEGEMAEIFGRYPKAGQNDGIFEGIATDLQNESLREMTPDQLVEALAKDRANYDEWMKATRDGARSLEDAKLEEHYAEELRREEQEARQRWESSGMDLPEYILSRIEEGEPGFDLDWETMREIAHDVEQGKFAVGGRSGAKELGIGGLTEAEAMEKSGADREGIWRKTGWWRGKDGKWRIEIPDAKPSDGTIVNLRTRQFKDDNGHYFVFRLGELVDGGQLNSAYPGMVDEITLRFRHGMPSYKATYSPKDKAIELSDTYMQRANKYADETNVRMSNDATTLIVHELQHAIQQREGFASGADADKLSIEDYHNTSGEVEARNVQARLGMTAEQRAATPPWETEDVAEARQIVKFAAGKDIAPSKLGDGKQRYYEVPFDKAVDKIVKNRKPVSDEHVFISETPAVFKDIGMPALPVMMNQQHVLSCYFGAAQGVKAGNMHGLGDRLKSLPKSLARPMMIIANETNPSSSVVAIVKMQDKDGHTVIVPVEINGIGQSTEGRITANIVKSAFGKKNLWSEKIAKALRDEVDGKIGVFYVDSNEARQISYRLAREAFNFGSSERQLLSGAKGTMHSLSDFASPVKGVGAQKDSQQFKRWFGDSKVVDENGEPLVVYRGAEFDPLAQEAGKGVIKPEAYFTADPNYAKRYTGAGGKVRAYYLNIRNPFDIRDPECLNDLKKIYPDHEFARGTSGALDWAEASIIDGEFLKENFGNKYDGIIFDEGGDPTENGPAHRGVSYVPLDGGAQVKSATDNIGTFDPGNPDVRFAAGGQVVGDWIIGPNGIARRGTPQAAMIGGARVADDAGRGEQTPGSMAAALERLNAPRTTMRTIGTVRPTSLPLSEMEFLRKYLTGDHLPATVARKIAGGRVAAHTKAGRLTISSEIFGLVDKTDVAPAKDRLKEHGFFRNEDEAWAAAHSPAEVRRERERSENQLGDELLKLADRRARGAEAGGVYANELAKIVMEMPRKEGGVIGRIQKIGDAVRANVKAIAGERGSTSAKATADESGNWKRMTEEARKFLDWARGSAEPESGAQKTDRELTDEMFASWLTMPEEMSKIAPTWHEAILRTVAETPKLAEAFKELSMRALSKDSHRAVFEAVRKSQSREVEKALKELEADRTEKISAGGRIADAKEKIIVTFHDTLGAVAVRIDEKTRQYLSARRKVLADMKAKGATKAEIAAVQDEIDIFAQRIGHLKNRMELSRSAMERGAWNEGRRYMLQYLMLENKATKKWGLTEEDKSAYLDMMRIVETQGRAASYGMDPRQAQMALGDMARRLGAEKWARLAEYGREFFSVMEREFLSDPRVERMWGKGMIDYFRTQAHYVTTKRVHSKEELDAIETARAKAKAAGINGGDDVIGAMFDYTGPRGGAAALGLSESAWTAKLTGSMGAKQEVRSATWEKQQMLMQSARRNQFVLDLRDALLAAKVEGVRDVERGEKDVKPGSRYGTINYVENGKRRTLIVPRQIADGMKTTPDNMPWLTKFHNAARTLMIDWNVAYWNRNIMRNSGSIEKNMPGMHETWLKTVLRVAPGMAPTVDLACQHLARHSKGAAKVMTALFGRDTIFPYIQQAGRMAKLLEDPTAWQERLWDAEARGDAAEVAEMHEDLTRTMEMLKGNMFLPTARAYGNRDTQGFANDMMNKAGFRMVEQMQRQAAKTRFGRAVDLAKSPLERNRRQQEYEDVLAKTIAYLHDRANYGLQRSVEESGLMVKRNVSIAEGERKGTESRTIQRYMTQFFNMTEKGVLRTVRAVRERPGETLGKMARTWVGRFVGAAMTYGLVTRAIRALYGDDEEKAKASPLGDVYGFAKWVESANRNLSNYVRNHYQTIPLWVSEDGYTTICIGTPLNDEDSLLAPSADFAARAFANSLGANNELALGQMLADTFIRPVTPDLAIATPALKVIRDTIESTLVENPTDLFTGAPTYDQDLYALRNESWETRGDFALAMARQVWNDVGARGFMAIDRNGVDNGMGAAPKWIGIALKRIPIISPVLNSFIKVQVGSPEKDAKPIRAVEQRLQHVRNYISQKLMTESAKNGGALNQVDPTRYAELLDGWQKEYGLSDHDMRLVEMRFLNGWREYENEEARRRKVINRTIRKARKMGIDEAERYMIRGEL